MHNTKQIISIANQYTHTPGARHIIDGAYSGEEFRDTFLKPLFNDINDTSEIIVDLDGTYGYGTSFLEEAFGGLARIFGKEICLRRLRFISNDDKLLIEEITGYIDDVK
jgi:hypothetical protein